jgi:hypothetical protein
MATLELDDAEMALLRMLVDWRLSGLTVEISHTDSRDYREMLRQQREALEGLAQRLAASAVT